MTSVVFFFVDDDDKDACVQNVLNAYTLKRLPATASDWQRLAGAL